MNFSHNRRICKPFLKSATISKLNTISFRLKSPYVNCKGSLLKIITATLDRVKRKSFLLLFKSTVVLLVDNSLSCSRDELRGYSIFIVLYYSHSVRSCRHYGWRKSACNRKMTSSHPLIFFLFLVQPDRNVSLYRKNTPLLELTPFQHRCRVHMAGRFLVTQSKKI